MLHVSRAVKKFTFNIATVPEITAESGINTILTHSIWMDKHFDKEEQIFLR
ncbi:MAG: hypothetical protein K9H16_03430 [Bacteroidales bacterium]|nr:hypothetical protein [Bacteroidales bacterium]